MTMSSTTAGRPRTNLSTTRRRACGPVRVSHARDADRRRTRGSRGRPDVLVAVPAPVVAPRDEAELPPAEPVSEPLPPPLTPGACCPGRGTGTLGVETVAGGRGDGGAGGRAGGFGGGSGGTRG